ncbi:Uncharacterised protein [Streptococcus dysgalactiae subsp. equisimilis]|nr:Uncharacterised protein [Streptococcus dysgalactiae subsp. equisimilis]VTS50017.1 Uncharacterised protein [Streptococcus dysgalactiae subsp. equisimilis]
MKACLRQLNYLKEELERGIDMLIKLYAVNVIAGRYLFARIPKVIQGAVKSQIVLMVDDPELIKQLTEVDKKAE